MGLIQTWMLTTYLMRRYLLYEDAFEYNVSIVYLKTGLKTLSTY